MRVAAGSAPTAPQLEGRNTVENTTEVTGKVPETANRDEKQRLDWAKGLEQIAAFLRGHDDLPMGKSPSNQKVTLNFHHTDVEIAQKWAQALGVQLVEGSSSSTNRWYQVNKDFGSVSFEMVVFLPPPPDEDIEEGLRLLAAKREAEQQGGES